MMTQGKLIETFLENGRVKWFGHCLRREHNHVNIMCDISFWDTEQKTTESEMGGGVT